MSLSIGDVKKYLESAVTRQGFNQWMAPEIIVAQADRLELKMPIRVEMTQHHGFVHGGCVAAFADTAAAWSAALACCKDVVTSNYSVQLLAPAQGERLRAIAKPVKVGRSSATIDVKVFSVDDEGSAKICAVVLAGISILGSPKK